MNKAEKQALYTSLLVPVVFIAVLAEAPFVIAIALMLIAPVAVLRLVWVVLHDTRSPGPPLQEGHEWDYLDRRDLMARPAHVPVEREQGLKA